MRNIIKKLGVFVTLLLLFSSTAYAFDFSLPFFESNEVKMTNNDKITECVELMNLNTELWENRIPESVFEVTVGDEKYYIQQLNNEISLIESEAPDTLIWTDEDTLDDVHKILIDVDEKGDLSIYQTLKLLKIYKTTPIQTNDELNVAGQITWIL